MGQQAESALLVVPQLAALASWGGLSWLLATLRSQNEQLGRSEPNGWLRCSREARLKSPILRLSTPRWAAKAGAIPPNLLEPLDMARRPVALGLALRICLPFFDILSGRDILARLFAPPLPPQPPPTPPPPPTRASTRSSSPSPRMVASGGGVPRAAPRPRTLLPPRDPLPPPRRSRRAAPLARAAPPKMLGDGGAAAPLAAAPFAEMPGAPPTDELQALLRRDIGRRLSELVALGWLGRDHGLKRPSVAKG